jgi:hypothetical protein
MHKIPKFFHFIFGLKPQNEPFHLVHYLCLASCIKVNQPEKVFFHYDHLPYGPWWDLIKNHLILNKINPANFFTEYQYEDPNIAKYRYAHVSDIIRLEVLDHFGGVYADMDTLFINPIPDQLFSRDYVMGKELVDFTQEAARISGGSLCNAWIASAPDATFGKIWLDKIREEFDGTWSAHSTFLPYKLSLKFSQHIHIEPETSFYTFDWTKSGIQNIFVNNKKVSAESYSIHLWSHLWWSSDRTDYTTFHAGLITPNYVAYASTSYSQLSRQFLPLDVKTSRFTYLMEQTVFLSKKMWLTIKSITRNYIKR